MTQFWLCRASAAVYNHSYMLFGPNQPWICSIFGQNWGSAWQKILWLIQIFMYDSPSKCHDPCLWTIFDFVMLLYLCATIYTCYLDQTSPGICHSWLNLGVSLAVNGVFGWKTIHNSHPKLCRDSHEPNLTLECFCSSLQPCIDGIWAKSALELLVLGQN